MNGIINICCCGIRSCSFMDTMPILRTKQNFRMHILERQR